VKSRDKLYNDTTAFSVSSGLENIKGVLITQCWTQYQVYNLNHT